MVDKNAPEAGPKEYNEHFYKQIKTKKLAKIRLSNQKNNRAGLYEIVKRFLPKDKLVVDLGCGDGFLTNFIGNKEYIGIDFGGVLLKRGKELYPDRFFMEGDIKTKEVQKLFLPHYVYVCLEVLEHIIDDISVIKSIPKGSDFIFSVPDMNCKYHVRYFTSFEEIKNRFDDYLEFIDTDIFVTKLGYNTFISKTIIK